MVANTSQFKLFLVACIVFRDKWGKVCFAHEKKQMFVSEDEIRNIV